MFRHVSTIVVCSICVLLTAPAAAGPVLWDDGAGSAVKLWSDSANWVLEPPGQGDDIFLGNHPDAPDDTTTYDIPFIAQFNSLTMILGTDVLTNGFQLFVDGETVLGDNLAGDDAGTSIIVQPRQPGTPSNLGVPEEVGFVTESLLLEEGTVLDMRGGVAEIRDDEIDIDPGARLTGNGRVDVSSVPVVGVNNEGSIVVRGNTPGVPATLILEGDDIGSAIDLDGFSETGVVDVDDGTGAFAVDLTLVIDGHLPAGDAFDTTMEIGEGDAVDFRDNWATSAVINFNGRNGTATIRGEPLIASAAEIFVNSGTAVFENDVTISFNTTLTVEDDATLRLDGTATFVASANLDLSNPGTALIVNGATSIDQATFDWDGGGFTTTSVGANGSLAIDSANLDNGNNVFGGAIFMDRGNVHVSLPRFAEWQMNGTLTMFNLTIGGGDDVPVLSGSPVEIGNGAAGEIRVTGGGSSRITAPVTFFDRADVKIGAGAKLELGGGAAVMVNASFSGAGTLVNLGGNQLTVHDEVVIGVSLENQGTLELGAGAAGVAQINVAEFDQAASGALHIDLGGAGLVNFDNIAVSGGSATLDGALVVSLTGGFNPGLGNVFTILSTSGGVTGAFAGVTLPPLDPGLALSVVYNPTNVQLQVVSAPAFSADFDEDGDVDGDDLNEWTDAFGATDAADADGDNDSDGHDFLAWQRQLGSGPSPVASSTAAVPEPASRFILLTASLAFLLSGFRPRAV